MESDPNQYEDDESKFVVLKNSNQARLEILSDLLSNHLNISISFDLHNTQKYSLGYLLGRHDHTKDFLTELTPKMKTLNSVRSDKMALQFYSKGQKPAAASKDFLPILINYCPEDFNTVTYFEVGINQTRVFFTKIWFLFH